jgi:hypothetical protein
MKHLIGRVCFYLLSLATVFFTFDSLVWGPYDKALLLYGIPPGQRCTAVGTGEGFLQIYLDWMPADPRRHSALIVLNANHTDQVQRGMIFLRVNDKRHLGFSCYWLKLHGLGGIYSFCIPEIYLAILSAMSAMPLAVSEIRKSRRRRREAMGCCVRCGYDLRGSSSHCPECGTVAASASIS